MAYLAIARKYRPATFAGIVGQEHITRTLKNAIERDRVHHAFLFTGARGVGKTTAARALARALNCERGPTAEPCGECASCREIALGTSPDLIEIDGASNNSVEDIRELRERIHYAPTRGRKKIYIVDEVHMLSRGAFNALLKTLEEPPPHVVFIFATTEVHRIPETILSRVQRFDFKRIPQGDVSGRLREIADAEGVRLTERGLRMIARAGEGSMRDAQSLLDQVISFGGTDVSDEAVVEALGLIDHRFLFAFLRALVTGSADGALEAIDAVYAGGHDLTVFSSEMLETLRNATFLFLSPSSRSFLDLPAEEMAELVAAVEGADGEQLTRLFHAMSAVHEEVVRAERPRMALEMGVARLVMVRRLVPVDAMLTRLEDLERRLRQGGAPPPRRSLQPGITEDESDTPPIPPEPVKRPAPEPAKRPAPEPVKQPAPEPAKRPAPAPAKQPAPEPVKRPAPAPVPFAHHEAEDEAEYFSAPSFAGAFGGEQWTPPPFDPEAAWRALAAGWREDGTRYLPDGSPHFENGVLTVRLNAGLALSAGKVAAGKPAVVARVSAHYPNGTRLEVAAAGAVRQSAVELLEEARKHPAIAKAAARLRGKVVATADPASGEIAWFESPHK